ncbi:DegV family protein [Zongyangia hominis]|uniref:DegV family protein n=1 Tax=Zongyangia hominis TaxID=2763677 RepID=A0A926IB37_9FIRM|nr:DegV family protein [Zongyangia hominis]MBC8569762.1 DegV family protein [Zongyangia hominis]
MAENKGYRITTDNNVDLPDSYLKEHNLAVTYFTYTIDDVAYSSDDPNMGIHEFYDKMRGGSVVKTQQINPDQAIDFFRTYLQEGYDLLHVAFSSGLSGTFNNMRLAWDDLREEFPERKVIVVDSLCASMGQGLLVHKALELQKEGKSMEEVARWLEENRLHLCHNFTVEDLAYLHRGGRISKTTAVVGTMLGIKPVLHVDDAGKLVPEGKIRGRKQSLIALVDNMERKLGGYQNDVVFISHGDCEEDALFVKDLVEKRFGIKAFVMGYISPIIGAHSGPGTVALFFMGETR